MASNTSTGSHFCDLKEDLCHYMSLSSLCLSHLPIYIDFGVLLEEYPFYVLIPQSKLYGIGRGLCTLCAVGGICLLGLYKCVSIC